MILFSLHYLLRKEKFQKRARQAAIRENRRVGMQAPMPPPICQDASP